MPPLDIVLPVAKPVPTEENPQTQKRSKYTRTSLLKMWFEKSISVSEWRKAVYTVIFQGTYNAVTLCSLQSL